MNCKFFHSEWPLSVGHVSECAELNFCLYSVWRICDDLFELVELCVPGDKFSLTAKYIIFPLMDGFDNFRGVIYNTHINLTPLDQ
jgi:hypothetical protein